MIWLLPQYIRAHACASDTGSTECKDTHATCPRLKVELDTVNGSCFTTDMGKVTGNAAYNGKHLADECCASCSAATPGTHCAKCLADGHSRTVCAAIGVCNCYQQVSIRILGRRTGAFSTFTYSLPRPAWFYPRS